MEIQSFHPILRLLIAIALWFAGGSTLLYWGKPEEFFIRRFRPSRDVEYTHAQLLFRAFGGVGLISVALASFGVFVIISDDALVELRREWVFSVLPLGLASAICSYIHFRVWRYVEIVPSGRDGQVSTGQRIFVRRAAPNPKTWGLRLALIIIFAVAVVAGPAILFAWSIFMFELFG